MRLHWHRHCRPHLRQPVRRSGAGGYLMVEAALAMVLLTLVTVASLQSRVIALHLEQAGAAGDTLVLLRRGAEAYVLDNVLALQQGDAVSKNGVTLVSGASEGQSYRPGVANLIAMGYLPAGMSLQSTFGGTPGQYRITLERRPASCAAHPPDCDVVGLVYLDQPVSVDNHVDAPAIGAMLARLGGDGGSSIAGDASEMSANGGGWTEPNPVAGTPVGIVAGRFGLGSSGQSVFVRIGDARDPMLQGSLTVKNTLQADGLSTTNKSPGSACTVSAAIASDPHGVLQCMNGTWQWLTEFATPAASCALDGHTSIDAGSGQSLVCRHGQYVPLSSFLARNVLVDRLVVKDGDVVNKPLCTPGGTPDRAIRLNQVAVDVTIAPPKQALLATTVDLGATWQVQVRLRDDLGNEASGNGYNASAVMDLECRY